MIGLHEIYSRFTNVINGMVFVNCKKVNVCFDFEKFSFSTYQGTYMDEISPYDNDFAILIFKSSLIKKIGL